MKLFVKKLAIFLSIEATIVFLFCVLLLQIMPLYEESYTASLIDKIDRVESIDEPKIVLIGNSNLSFGIDSKLIEEELNMPVVNMGLHGGLGNAFHEEMAKININDDDIIIIAHTSFSDEDEISDTVLALSTLENHKSLWRLARPSNVIDIVKAIPRYTVYAAKNLIKKTIYTDPYSRNSFNVFGDVSALRNENKFILNEASKPPEINEICTDRINGLNELILQNNAYLLVAAYPINIGDFPIPYDEFDQFQEELENVLNCPVISNYTDYFFPPSLFYDNVYHLTSEGANIRTRLLIEDIKRWREKVKS